MSYTKGKGADRRRQPAGGRNAAGGHKSRDTGLGVRVLASAVALTVLVVTLWWRWRLNDPDSVPSTITYDVWPWARWLLLVLGLVAGVLLIRRWLVRRSPSALVAKWSKRSQRSSGLASRWQVMNRTGWLWLRWKATKLRPALAELPWWRRWRVPLTELGYRLCRINGKWAYASVEEVVGLIAPPRRGKTGELACNIIDAPGAVVATSTKFDIVELTAPLRSQRGEVYLFNPEGLAGAESTLRWNPVIGCEQVNVATERAGYLLAGAPTMANVSDRDFWQSQAVRVLRALMHAAAIKGGTMLDVLAWVSDIQGSGREVLNLLWQSPAGDSWRQDYEQFLDTNSNTGTSITTSIMPALQWLSDPKVAAATTCTPKEQFDVEEFINSSGTLYLLGEDKPHGAIAPLFTVLTAHIHTTAKSLASRKRSGRLDPPLTLALDEAPLLVPVPLERWSSDSGSRGIAIIWAAQSRSQLRWKWGIEAASIIWTNSTGKLIFGGCDDENDLAAYSALTGTRRTEEGEVVPVLSPAEIRTLEDWHVLVLRGGMRPAIGVVRPAWKRRDVKQASREAARAAKAADRAARKAAKAAKVAPTSPAPTGASSDNRPLATQGSSR